MENKAAIDKAKEHFGKLLEAQLERVEKIKTAPDWIDYSQLSPIKIGILPGDGIGPFIAAEAERVLRFMLDEDIKSGKIYLKTIEGLTIENRAKHNKAIPDDVLEEIKKYHVTLKGPTTTPRKGDPWPNIESCNVAMRKELDLFANVRPVRVPNQGIDWIFFRENTEDLYALGPYGIEVGPDIAIDFKLITSPGSERICRMALEYARKNNKTKVTCITKANVVKTTDGKFLEVFYNLAKEYPELQVDDWYIDIMTAKLVDEKRRREFQVMVLPNLYGDILTDEAAEFQGGVGTAGAANIGKQYAMFEAIHGSAPRMVKENRAIYADPASMIRAAAMLINHIGYTDKAKKLEMALDICGQYEKKLVITGRPNGATGKAFTDYLIDWLNNPKLQETWEGYVKG
ncbi:MAG: isocitrate/isopropylmalate family dehydrogenase [Acidobacteriota bacterium]|nr:isocitrate/isopropylmalate family dehydrogenase [Acidobacteriota bacterium]MDW3228537.1 isocitrate/isopropylmalate family dehydrogenase [Acidobacteriota bacterium]MDY0231293.1 isocitrate/isopropylmalate family dehydrogenase [Candidatus Saccharicenans sp.]